MEFEQVHCPVPLLNYSVIPSSSSATIPDVMRSRDASEQDQLNSPPVEKKIIRFRFFPTLTLEVTVDRIQSPSSPVSTGFAAKTKGKSFCS